jgi:glycosyltransferase involved in cell wall biosynthesis
MKVVFISVWYSEGMGYSENMFPKAMAKLGPDVHVVTSTAQIYYHAPTYDKVYKPYLGPNIVDPVVKVIDGYTLHRLPYYETKNIYHGPGMVGLYEYLEKLKPDVIQTFEIFPESSYIAAKYALEHDCAFFTECHTHASVLRKDNKKTLREHLKSLLNNVNPKLRLTNKTAKICYPIADDVAEIAINYFGVAPSKIKIQSLGVDTDTFARPQTSAQVEVRKKMREHFGFVPEDIVCIYTGRFTKDKNPHCLAEAIQELNNRNLPFKGLFIGNGTNDDIDFISSKSGCKIGEFVPAKELPAYYWCADIGVWPREESTSQLDAMACGLPLVISDRIKVVERIEGNGYMYKEGDSHDLALILEKLSDPITRKQFSITGEKKINSTFSWKIIAAERLSDYKLFLGKKRKSL